ncbi:MAG: HAD family phosphatase [Planctomycetes bacterium]|nr:HAD family phosphatase [Planctomycetota bacterium]
MIPPRICASDLIEESCAQGVLFDMDGVLADTEACHVEAWVRLMDRHGAADVPADLIRATFGQTNDTIIPRLYRYAGQPAPERLGELSREKETFFREAARGRLKPLRGLPRFLDWLRKRGIPLAIGTSAPIENVRFLLDEFGWNRYFCVVVDRSRFAAGKPAPDCFLKAAELLRMPPERVLVFEDSMHGLLAARRGRFQPCAVGTTLPEAELRRHARWVIRDFRDIAC